MAGLLRLCNAQDETYIPAIWTRIAPLSKERKQAAMDPVCRKAANRIIFCAPRINHSIVVMVLALAFYTKDPGKVGGDIEILLFPDLSPSEGSEVALLTHHWEATLG